MRRSHNARLSSVATHWKYGIQCANSKICKCFLVCLTYRSSVCPCVTLLCCTETTTDLIKLFLSLKKPLPSCVFVPIRRSKYRRGTPSAGTLYRQGVGKIRNFLPISLPILETVGPYSYCGTSTESRMYTINHAMSDLERSFEHP